MSVLLKVNIFMPQVTKAMVDFYIDALPESVSMCLANYSEDEQEQALALYVMHNITLSSGGQVVSDRTRTGAARTYAAPTGSGLKATNYGSQLLALSGAAKCLIASKRSARPFAHSVGG